MRWSPLLLAFMAAACVHHSPRAAVPVDSAATVPKCQSTSDTQATLHAVARELRAQGMLLLVRCEQPHAGWVVQVRVVDGMKASQIVRGPLADGHDVDMGTPPGVPLAAARADAKDFSPDVQYNRHWLQGVMERHQFRNLPDAWWHFLPRSGAQATATPTGGDTNLAER